MSRAVTHARPDSRSRASDAVTPEQQSASPHDHLKMLSAADGVPVRDLIALSPQNDPFFMGSPAQRRDGEWFADALRRVLPADAQGIHLRQIHYRIVSQREPLAMPSGLPYQNTERCWQYLLTASKCARYLKLVDIGAFTDRRNGDPVIFAPPPAVDLHVGVEPVEPDVPVIDDDLGLPTYLMTRPVLAQPCHVEIWIEKTTMHDVLRPLCREYGVNLVAGAGELSITAVHLLLGRMEEANKPTRILYISDFDPAGQGMPISVARKAEFLLRSADFELDLQLNPIALTEKQVREYQLPRIPIKDTDRRKAGFETQFGTGAVELDALEGIHPGELARIVEREIQRFIDPTLAARTQRAVAELEETLGDIRNGVLEDHRDEVEVVLRRVDEARRQLEKVRQSGIDLWGRIAVDLRAQKPDGWGLPEARPTVEWDEPLFDSRRDYREQIDAYKRRRSRSEGPR